MSKYKLYSYINQWKTVENSQSVDQRGDCGVPRKPSAVETGDPLRLSETEYLSTLVTTFLRLRLSTLLYHVSLWYLVSRQKSK